MSGFYNNSLFQYLAASDPFSLIFIISVVISALVTFVLFYHWLRYSVGALSIVTVIVLYSFGVMVCLGSMFSALQGL